jgi:hypothetical protein
MPPKDASLYALSNFEYDSSAEVLKIKGFESEFSILGLKAAVKGV